jgi:hypothetical protein
MTKIARPGPHLARPEPGLYRIRRVKGGVSVPVKIWRPCLCTIGGSDEEHQWTPACDRFPALRALIDGWEDADPMTVWNSCRPIEPAEYEFLVNDHAWARSHAGHLPQANPRLPVNLEELDPLF